MVQPENNSAEPPLAAAAYPSLGAFPERDGVRFRVWAPKAGRVDLILESTHEPERSVSMERDGEDFVAFVEGLGAGARYRYRLDGEGRFPDPAARFQPEGVHGPSEVVDLTGRAWSDADWHGVPQEDLVFYELHVGTFTPEGTFEAAAQKLDHLVDLGVTAVELMPIHAFPGMRNWGYDPGAYFAPAHAYGRPEDLQAFVDAAHGKGLAVFLDVVYNHLGPDGSYLPVYSDRVFSTRHRTMWGDALNFDDEGSRGLRRFFVENALHWLDAYHVDGFRLDATFAIVDESDPHFLAELASAVARLPGRKRPLIAEDARNLRTLLEPREEGGMGLDGVWADDFHHQVRSALAGDDHGYYRDFTGLASDLVRTIDQGWFYTGQRSMSADAPRGTPADGIPRDRFVYCISNHDQVGNRAQGERLNHDISDAAYRAATALLLFLPQLPLLFMGQEWGASTPFLYFTDHGEELGRAVTKGRAEEFKDFPFEDVPDPQDPDTFERSKLRWEEPEGPPHSATLRLYRDLLAWRKHLGGDVTVESPTPEGLVLHRGRHRLLVALAGNVELPKPEGMEVRLSTEEPVYTAAPQPPEIGGEPVRSPHIPRTQHASSTVIDAAMSESTAPESTAPAAIASDAVQGGPEPLAADRVRFWRPAALLWEAV